MIVENDNQPFIFYLISFPSSDDILNNPLFFGFSTVFFFSVLFWQIKGLMNKKDTNHWKMFLLSSLPLFVGLYYSFVSCMMLLVMVQNSNSPISPEECSLAVKSYPIPTTFSFCITFILLSITIISKLTRYKK